MAQWLKLKRWITRLRQRFYYWQLRRIVMWEDRHITRYNRIIADALLGIRESQANRTKARTACKKTQLIEGIDSEHTEENDSCA